ncbi:dicer-like 105 [Zea mays]|uniref:Dicer-like 105 n=1 Tax=Zea mays TaxID=4577 RepID=A0A1D6GMA8_MAIZE|nr:dicer-like 105 [Zea mays]
MTRAAAEAAGEVVVEEDLPPSCDPQTQARWYQLEALERALAGNTLVFLETGAGKTLIAVLLLRRFAHRIRSSPPPSFAVFLVPTVVLVNQQAGVIKEHTDLRVAQFYGDMGVDFWNADTWRGRIDGAEVLVMTPQILLDNLRHSIFRLRDIPLLIFDECHRATGNSPYACILKEFYHPQLNSRPSDSIPTIFGMTASLIARNLALDKYSEEISEFENLMNAKVYTVASESALLQYIPIATTKIVEYDDYIVTSELYSHTIRCLNKLETKVLLYALGMTFCWMQIDYVTLRHPVCNPGIFCSAFCIILSKHNT